MNKEIKPKDLIEVPIEQTLPSYGEYLASLAAMESNGVKLNTRPLRFTDGIMFQAVMSRDHDLCRRLLEVLLQEEINRIDNVITEATLSPALGAHAVRLDAFVESKDRLYDIEIQTCREHRLGRRFRYYQGALDVSWLNRGNEYGEMLDSVIIFIVGDDEVGFNLPVYTYERICLEDHEAHLGDGSTWIVINPKAYAKLPKGSLRDLLEYLDKGRVDSSDQLVCDLADAVTKANEDEALRREGALVLTFEEDIKLKMKYAMEDAVKEAREQGLEQGRNQLGILWERLTADGRMDEAVAMMRDEKLQQSLLSEYKII